MALAKQRNAIMALFVVCSMLCSGCIAGGNNGETVPPTTTVAPTTTPPTTTVAPTTVPPTTVPPNVNTKPILASELLEEWNELQDEFPLKEAEMQETLSTVQAMLVEADPDYELLYEAFTLYQTDVVEYVTTQTYYYKAMILTEHTTPTEGDLLALKKETLPFTRPGGKTYTFGELNMKGESYMALTRNIELLIRDGINGNDVRTDIVDALENLGNFLPEYYDMGIGYVYRKLGSSLYRQSLYSDILIRDCNPDCI
jgi:hypothetical protein